MKDKAVMIREGEHEYYFKFNLSLIQSLRMIYYIRFGKEFQFWKDDVEIKELK